MDLSGQILPPMNGKLMYTYGVSMQHFTCLCSGLNKKLVLINTTMTWTVAQNYCRRYYTDLASVRNKAENKQIKNLISKGQRVWIGLFRDAWKWTDGTRSSFRYWSDNEPDNRYKNETCVLVDLKDNNKWADVMCNQETAFVCHKGEW